MITVGEGAQRQVDNIKMSWYALYLTVQNADSSKPIVAQAQTYFAFQTRRAAFCDSIPFYEALILPIQTTRISQGRHGVR